MQDFEKIDMKAKNIKNLNKDSIHITDFSFASVPVWLGTKCYCVRAVGAGGCR